MVDLENICGSFLTVDEEIICIDFIEDVQTAGLPDDAVGLQDDDASFAVSALHDIAGVKVLLGKCMFHFVLLSNQYCLFLMT